MATKSRPINRGNRTVAKPTYEYITALWHDVEREFAKDNEQIERTRQVRDLERQVQVPNEYRLTTVEVRDPTIADEVQRVTAELTIKPAHINITPQDKESETSQENADLRSRWTEEVLRVAATRFPGRDTRTEMIDAIAGDGGSWSKFVMQQDIWEDVYGVDIKDFEGAGDGGSLDAKGYDKAVETAAKKAGPPFTWTSVDARCVYPVFQGNKLGEVLEVTECAENSIFRQYRLGRTKNGQIRYAEDITPEELKPGTYNHQVQQAGATNGTVFRLEHWDRVYVTYSVVGHDIEGAETGQIVAQWKHGYKRPPYFYGPGLTRNYHRNRKVGWGISESKRWLVEYRSFLWTLLANIASRDAFAPVIITSDPGAEVVTGEDGQPKGKEYWEPRQVYRLKPGQDMHVLQWADIAPSLKEQLQIVNEAIQELSTPRPTSDIGSNMEGAGFAINQVLAEVKTRHNPLVQSAERVYEEITEFLWFLMTEKVKEKVWVYASGNNAGWVGLGPSDLKQAVSIEWQLDPEQPSAKLIEARYWTERLQQGSAYLDMVIRAMGDSPDEIRRGKMIDQIRASQPYQQEMLKQVTQAFGRGDLTAKAAQYIAQTGQMPPTGGAPGGSPAGMQGGPGPQGDNMVPNMGALAMSPNQQGAAGQPMPQMPQGPVPGVGPGAVVPQVSATPSALNLIQR